MRERAFGSFFSGTFLIPRTINLNIIQKIKMIINAPISLKRFSQVRKLFIQVKNDEVCSQKELPALLSPSDTSSMIKDLLMYGPSRASGTTVYCIGPVAHISAIIHSLHRGFLAVHTYLP